MPQTRGTDGVLQTESRKVDSFDVFNTASSQKGLLGHIRGITEHGQVVMYVVSYHAVSVWYFTYSDIKTIIAPSAVFGAIFILHFGDQSQPALVEKILMRVLLMVFWAWSNLLPFAIDNQRQPNAINEDALNKPWRSLPSKRMTPNQAKMLMMLTYLTAIAWSIYLGGLKQCLSLIALGIYYNDLGGADENAVIRNFINGCGFLCYTSGALEVGLDIDIFELPELRSWFTLIFAIVFTTVQTQDMYDQAGDRLKGRVTVPLWIGDVPARWSIALPMGLLWSWAPVSFWRCNFTAYLVPASLSWVVAWRTLRRREVSDDKLTFVLWNLWLVLVYTLPLQKNLDGIAALSSLTTYFE